MNTHFVSLLLASVRTVALEKLSARILFGTATAKRKIKTHAEVCATIGLTGDATGYLALCLPMSTAQRMAKKLLGVGTTETYPDFADALGEFLLAILQRAHPQFCELTVNIGLPHVILGTQLDILARTTRLALSLPCDSALGRFSLEIMVEITKTSPPSAALEENHRPAEQVV